jgi:hypothetical protein
MPQIITVDAPSYSVQTEPDHKAIGALIDEVIKKNFMGNTIVARGISSSAHPDKSIDELIEIITTTGTDRYDPTRAGDRYDNIQGKRIDLFGFRRKVTHRMQLFKDISWGFYHGAKVFQGEPVRIDIVTIYDASRLKAVLHQYEGREDKKRDGFKFRRPDNKVAAVLGVIKIM